MTEKARIRRNAFAEIDNNPKYAWVRTQNGRRRLIALHVLWGAAGYLGVASATIAPYGWLSDTLGSTATLTLTVASIVVWFLTFIVLTGWLNASVSGVTELPYQILDEAQTAVRREAESAAHRITRAVLAVLGFGGALALGLLIATRQDRPETFTFTFSQGSVHTASVWTVIAVMATLSLLATLSTYLLAWRLPDAIADVDVEQDAR